MLKELFDNLLNVDINSNLIIIRFMVDIVSMDGSTIKMKDTCNDDQKMSHDFLL